MFNVHIVIRVDLYYKEYLVCDTVALKRVETTVVPDYVCRHSLGCYGVLMHKWHKWEV